MSGPHDAAIDARNYHENKRLKEVNKVLYDALANLENDAGHIPDHAWKMVQDALLEANPNWRVKP